MKPRTQPVLRAHTATAPHELTARNAPYLQYRGETLAVDELDDQSVNAAMLDEMHMDLSIRQQLTPKLTDEALVETAEKYLSQCSPDGVAVTYDQMLIQHIVPELTKRLKEKDDCEDEKTGAH